MKVGHSRVAGQIKILVLFIFIIFLFFLFLGKNISFKKEKDINLNFIGPSRAVVGEEVTFLIEIENSSNLDVQSGDFTLNFPEGFYLIETNKACSEKLTNGCTWRFNKIKVGKSKFLEIKGKFFSPSHSLTESKDFKGVFNFYLTGLTSSFQKEIEKKFFIDPVLRSNLIFPEDISIGRAFDWKYEIENKLNQNLKNLRISLEFPTAFSFVLKENKNIQRLESFAKMKSFLVKDLKGQEIKVIKFSGLFNGPVKENENQIKVIVFLKAPDGKFYEQDVLFKKINLVKIDIIFSLKVEDGKSYPWGAEIPMVLIYQSKSKEEIQNLSLGIEVKNAHFIDWLQLNKKTWTANIDSVYKTSNYWLIRETNVGKEIVWNRLNLPNFELVKSYSSGKIKFKLRLIPKYLANKKRYINPVINFKVKLICRPVSAKHDLKLQINGPEIKIKTQVSFSGEARYYNDENMRVGSGPIPPCVDRQTKYFVYLRIKNTCNVIENLRVETILPEGVIFTGSKYSSIGLIKFDKKSRKVVWEIKKLMPYSGEPFSSVEARFEVAIIPKEEDIGHILPLTSAISLSGIDSWTHEKIFKQISFLDTNIKTDPVIPNRGRVTR